MLARPTTSHTRAPRRAVIRAAGGKDKTEAITGVVFQPFEEVAPVLKDTSKSGALNDPRPEHSFARYSTWTETVEAAVNEQINVEYNISYVYHAISTYFDRDNVSLHGIAEYFRNESEEEKSHAQYLIDLQNTRGGRVKFNALVPPEANYDHPEKGDALYAFELALALEKLNYSKLLGLWEVADKNSDAQTTQFIEDMLHEQVKDIKQVSDYVAQLRRIGKGHAVWHWDRALAEGKVDHRAVESPKA
ncbi:Ferritin-2, chloroplastic [Auxenochlorella protothecoides]|nr:Ferritin-2, chloroplastic [Auxenochlorella protothecoides]KFM27389.1 Ferritin-2, chloroplastic [Auxenochlorella protothecoides]